MDLEVNESPLDLDMHEPISDEDDNRRPSCLHRLPNNQTDSQTFLPLTTLATPSEETKTVRQVGSNALGAMSPCDLYEVDTNSSGDNFRNTDVSEADGEILNEAFNGVEKGETDEIPWLISQKCAVHRNNDVEYFCVTHDQIACAICQHISHRACHSLRKLSDVSVNIASETEFHAVRDKLDNLDTELEKNLELVDENSKCLDAVFEETLSDVGAMLKRLYNQDKSVLEAIAKNSRAIKQDINTIQRAMESRNPEQQFLTMKRAETEVTKFKESLRSARQDAKITRYGLVPSDRGHNNDDQGQRQCNEILGQLCVFPLQLKNIPVETVSDRHHCSVSGLEVLDNDRIIVSDNGNKKVKLFSTKTRLPLFELPMETTPLFTTILDANTIALSLTNEPKMFILSVTNEINVVDEFETEDLPQNVGSWNGKIITSYSGSPRTQIIARNGRVENTFEYQQELRDELSRPKTLDGRFNLPNDYSQSNDIYQALCNENMVVQMSPSGKIMEEFQANEMKYPTDIAYGKDGFLFVCCRDSDNIFKLSNNLLVGHVILNEKHGLVSPWCVSYCDINSVLYVGSYGGKYIQTFKL